MVAIEWLLEFAVAGQSVSDSQFKIKTLQCKNTIWFAIKCRSNLRKLSIKCNKAVSWVKGQRNIPDNCMADELVRGGALLSNINHAQDASVPRYISKYMLKLSFGHNWEAKRYRHINFLDWFFTSLTVVLTGQCLMGLHGEILGFSL